MSKSIITHQTPVPQKHPIGRPTKYHPDMCAKVIELMREGDSKEEVAAVLGLGSKQRIYDYCEKYEEFRDAIKEGELLSAYWWTQKGKKNLDNKEFNSTLWYMNMKNRFGWTDKSEQTHNVKVEEITESKLKEIKEKYGREY